MDYWPFATPITVALIGVFGTWIARILTQSRPHSAIDSQERIQTATKIAALEATDIGQQNQINELRRTIEKQYDDLREDVHYMRTKFDELIKAANGNGSK